MPEEVLWATFFQPDDILDRLGVLPGIGDIVEFGCGYGTFTLPAARRCSGTVFAFDIEPEMAAITSAKAQAEQLANVQSCVRDFVQEGTGLPDDSMHFAMLFNILHAEDPQRLLAEARRILRPGGWLGIIHWNYDASTPRGPSMTIRPKPEQCRDWALEAGFQLAPPGIISLPPYHYGLTVRK